MAESLDTHPGDALMLPKMCCRTGLQETAVEERTAARDGSYPRRDLGEYTAEKHYLSGSRLVSIRRTDFARAMQFSPLAISRIRLRRVCAILGGILVTASSCQSTSRARVDLRQRGRELTHYLYAGAFDSLPRSVLLDLGGSGDSVLARWFVSRQRQSLGREWPSGPLLTLEGPQAGPTFLARLEETYGREVEMLDEAVYPCYQPFCERPYSLEYNRIARFSGNGDNTLTIAWLWTNDSLVGGWVLPSRRAVPSELEKYQPRTTLRLPFDGEWEVLWGGMKPHENYHVQVPALRFAYDFVMDSADLLHRTDGRSNADFFCYGHPILAPAAGQVAMALDSFPENVPGTPRRGYRGPGNFVTIDHGEGESSVLAHLRRGSVRVAAGQRIEAGDIVGECGNNGDSTLPHLHYQLLLGSPPGWRPVPAPFSNFVAEGVRVRRGIPTRGQRVVHAARP